MQYATVSHSAMIWECKPIKGQSFSSRIIAFLNACASKWRVSRWSSSEDRWTHHISERCLIAYSDFVCDGGPSTPHTLSEFIEFNRSGLMSVSLYVVHSQSVVFCSEFSAQDHQRCISRTFLYASASMCRVLRWFLSGQYLRRRISEIHEPF